MFAAIVVLVVTVVVEKSPFLHLVAFVLVESAMTIKLNQIY